MEQPKPILFLKVSILSHVEICPKRSKSETYSKLKGSYHYGSNSATERGKKHHKEYGYYETDFDHEILRSNLELYKIKGAFQKVIELPECVVVVRGDYDDLRILTTKIGKVVSFIELKTTNKKYMWELEIRAAIRQLQIYLWLLKELSVMIGYPLWKHHYLEIFSQKTGEMMRRIMVEEDPNIEEWIKEAVYKFIGLSPMTICPYKYCIICPDSTKSNCNYFKMRVWDSKR